MYRFFSHLAQKHARKVLLVLTVLVGISLIFAFVSLTKLNLREATMKGDNKINAPEREAMIVQSIEKAKKLYPQGGLREALSILKECERKCGSDPRLFTEMGYIHERLGELKKAESFYKKALRLNPDFFPALNNLGNLYLKAGKKEKALGLLQRASTIQPDSYLVHYSLGLAYQSMGKLDKALSEYRVALSLNQNDPDIYMMLGMLYDKAGEYKEAIFFYKNFLKLYPKGVPQYEKVAQIARNRVKELLSGGANTTLH